MKILHFYKTSMPDSCGGVEKFIDTLCKVDSSLGVKNTILALSKEPHKNSIKMNLCL